MVSLCFFVSLFLYFFVSLFLYSLFLHNLCNVIMTNKQWISLYLLVLWLWGRERKRRRTGEGNHQGEEKEGNWCVGSFFFFFSFVNGKL